MMTKNFDVEAELELPLGQILFIAGSGQFGYDQNNGYGQVSCVHITLIKQFEGGEDLLGQEMTPDDLPVQLYNELSMKLIARVFEDGEYAFRKDGLIK